MRKLKELSVFFPFYNEEKNIEKIIKQALKIIPTVANKFEIIIVNDGSTDKTRAIAEKLKKEYANIVLVNQENKGYGGAISTGFKTAQYEWVFFSDGDLQFDLSEILEFIQHTNTYDLVIGYRKKRAEGFKRDFITKLLKVWNKIFFNFPSEIKDIDCAFKLIKKDVLNKILPLSSMGGLVSTEMLLKCKKGKFKIKQLPVSHFKRNAGESTGDNTKVIKKAISETISLLRVFPERRDILIIRIIWILVFFIVLPLAYSINYMQNDEYTHYGMVTSFMHGNFNLDPYLGATFYVQGIISTIFALIFGIAKIPILTYTLSIAGIYIFNLILIKYFKVSVTQSILYSLILFLSPLYLYSTWGFMTENYFMFFLFCSLYFIYDFIHKNRNKSFILSNIFIWLSYLVRQFGLVTALAFPIYLFIKKRFKYAAIQSVLSVTILIFHFYIFPKTPQMYDGNLAFKNFFHTDRVITTVYVILIYLTVFLLPFLVISLLKKCILKPKHILLLLLIPLMYIYVTKRFEPENIYFNVRTRQGTYFKEYISPEFPYFINVFTRKGFLEDNLEGDKYTFPGYFDLFRGMETIGKYGTFILLLYLIISFKKVDKFALIYLSGFVCLLLITPRIFDRYLLPLVFVTSLLLVSNNEFSKTKNIILGGSLLFWLFLGYQFTMDFVLVNKYVWNDAIKLSNELNIPKNLIKVDNSWQNLYPNKDKRKYIYAYSNFKSENNAKDYNLIKQYDITFPFSFYNNPTLYLYQSKH